MTFELDARDLATAEAGLHRLDELVGEVGEPLLDDAGEAAFEAVRSRAGRHRVTGRMVQQVRVERTGEGVRHEVRVRAGGPIAAIVAGGSVPHDIRPLRARALALGGNVRGRFAERVRHPGTRPDPFVERAFEDSTASVDRAADQAVDRLAARLADVMEG